MHQTPLRSLVATINVPALIIVFAALLLGQTLNTGTLLDPPAHAKFSQLVLVWTATALHCVLLVLLIALCVGAVASVCPRGVRAFLWASTIVAASSFFWDYVGYNLVRQHLIDAVRLLWQNIFLDRQIMRGRTGALLLILAGYVVVWVGGSVLFYARERSWSPLAWKVSCRSLLTMCIVLLIVATGSEMLASRVLPPQVYRASLKSNISLTALVRRESPPADALFFIRSPKFRPPPQLDNVDLTLSSSARTNQIARPDIFFFVIESLRRDCTTAEVTPHLDRFSKRCLEIDKTVANANQTHYSLSAIVHGINPFFHGTYFYRSGYPGAVPMRVLKQLGYKIKVLAAPDLAYFTFAKGTFGRDLELADEYLDQKEVLKRGYKDSAEIDAFIADELVTRVSGESRAGPSFYFVVFDSSHIDYFWGKDFKPRFLPYCEKVRVVPVGFDPAKIEPLRNRYKNAVAYIDELMGRALEALEKQQRLENSIIVVTGDHGEEFLERGHVAHGSEPNHFQLNVPILMHLSGAWVGRKFPIASHVDIFPTIFDFLHVDGEFKKVLSGHSLIGSTPPSWAICVQQYGESVPMTLAFDVGDRKLLVEILGGERVGRSFVADFAVGSRLLDADDHDIKSPTLSPGKIPPEFATALGELIR